MQKTYGTGHMVRLLQTETHLGCLSKGIRGLIGYEKW
jgi:hypothetical protein